MAHRVLDGVKQLATGTGTGVLTLGTVFSDIYQTMALAGMTNGDTTYVRIQHETIEDQWEIALVSYSADVLTRTFDSKSVSPTGALTNFSAGFKIVSSVIIAKQVVTKDNNDNVSLPGELAVVQAAKTLQNIGGVYVGTNLADLKALTARPASVMILQGQAATAWSWVAGSTATADDYFAVQCTSGDAGRYIRVFDSCLSLRNFGAVGNGVADDSSAIDAWFLAVAASGLPGFMPPGNYKYTGTGLSWDLNIAGGSLSRKGGVIYGAGSGRSVIDVTACSGSPQFEIIDSSGAAFYWHFRNFGVRANTTGIGSQICQNFNGVSYPDFLNSCSFIGVNFNNDNASGDVALRMNGVLQSSLHIVVNNGGVGIGDAIQMFGVQFCWGGIAAGHATNGLHLSGYTYGNNFTCDIEVVNHCVTGTNAVGSGGPTRNKLGGVFVWGATNANPAISGNDGTTDCIVATFLGGPLIFDGASQFGSADPPQFTGAHLGSVAFEQRALGTADFGGIRISQPPGVPAIVQLDSEFGQTIQQQFRRDGGLRWLLMRDTTAETGSNAGSLIVWEAFDDSGNSLGSVLQMERGERRVSAPGLWATERMQLPAYLIGALPPVTPAAQIIYINNEAGGATLAFSDGTNWRRVTDNAIAS